MVRRVKADLKDVLHRVAARCSKFLRRPRRTESGRRLFCTRFKAFRMVKRTGRCPSGASSSTRRAICMAPPHMAAVDLASSRAQRRAAELCMNYRPHRRKAVSGRTRSSIIFRAETTANFPWGDLVFDNKGNLYGATQFGGGKGTTCDPFYQYCGTVFELNPPTTGGASGKRKCFTDSWGSPRGSS